MTRLNRLCLQDDNAGHWDENEHEQWAKLFEWVFRINHNLLLRLFSPRTLRLIRDSGRELYNRMKIEGYKESQDDIEAVSRIAEDIRDALLDHQVCSDKPYGTEAQLKFGHLDRWHSSRQYTTRTAS